MNSVVLIGRLAKDPDLRYTQNGKAVANFTIAVNKIYKQQGDNSADFINCVTWNKTAENLAQHQRKGNLIAVHGSIQTRSYQNNEGKTVYVTEVLANTVQYLDSKSKNNQGNVQNQQQGNFQNQQQMNYQNQQQMNYQNQQQGNFQNQQQGNFQNQGNFENQQNLQPMGMGDEGLPF